MKFVVMFLLGVLAIALTPIDSDAGFFFHRRNVVNVNVNIPAASVAVGHVGFRRGVNVNVNSGFVPVTGFRSSFGYGNHVNTSFHASVGGYNHNFNRSFVGNGYGVASFAVDPGYGVGVASYGERSFAAPLGDGCGTAGYSVGSRSFMGYAAATGTCQTFVPPASIEEVTTEQPIRRTITTTVEEAVGTSRTFRRVIGQ